jgi:16S rRNA (guanine966-N2)-methyltransferase
MARGKKKEGRRGASSVGGEVRPTTQKILESLSAILQPRTEGAVVLDLFAGTGRVGMSLARFGAEKVVFVEGHRRVGQTLRTAIREHESRDSFSLVIGAVPQVLGKLKGLFDIIVCDPPYDWNEGRALLQGVLPILKPDGVLVVEHHHKTAYPEVDGLAICREEKFGETRLTFFEREATCS